MSNLKIGLIGGSGLGAALAGEMTGKPHLVETPFGRPSGEIIEGEWGGVPVLFLGRHGPGHRFNPSQVPYRANIFALKKLGCTHILASGAVGSLREEIAPKDLVVVDQVIDKTIARAGTFYDTAAVHVEMAEPFCPVMRKIILEVAKGHHVKTHGRGTYVCMEGPAFSTRAESLMHRLWGGDVIGMTAMPEAKLAKEAEIPYAMIALATDYDAWRPHDIKMDPFALLNEIIGNLKAATEAAIGLMKLTVAEMAKRETELEACPAPHALRLGIWSDKSKLSRMEVERLSVLWGKYFTGQ
jgi:5'-methylthioadenosine phosphorylase